VAPLPQISPTNDVIDSPANEVGENSHLTNHDEEDSNLAREQERCRELEEKVEQLTKNMAEEERQRMSLEKQMRDEIRRLHRELKLERENSKRGHSRLFITARRPGQPADKPR
jgi:predicted transcriptional regulator